METATRLSELRQAVDRFRAAGETVALVPTMGALHEGHLTLVRQARERAGRVIVSIFVNPTQFGPNEDLAAYPRQLAEDSRMLDARGVDLVWAPGVSEVYPEGFATTVSVGGLGDRLCGAARPGHFDGVATVVAKLFNQVRPDVALFGEKDWQQLAIIRRMASDLDFTLPAASAIIGVPTVREPDGLALSSRNRYLTSQERSAAAVLPRALAQAAAALRAGEKASPVLAAAREAMVEGGFREVEYLELIDQVSLLPIERAGPEARLAVAAKIGRARLIDNLFVGAPL